MIFLGSIVMALALYQTVIRRGIVISALEQKMQTTKRLVFLNIGYICISTKIVLDLMMSRNVRCARWFDQVAHSNKLAKVPGCTSYVPFGRPACNFLMLSA